MDGIEDFRRLVFGILDGGDPDEPDYLKIQKRHSESIAKWLQTGRQREDYRSGIDGTLFDNILMPGQLELLKGVEEYQVVQGAQPGAEFHIEDVTSGHEMCLQDLDLSST